MIGDTRPVLFAVCSRKRDRESTRINLLRFAARLIRLRHGKGPEVRAVSHGTYERYNREGHAD
jgi:hypothetical protein